MVVLAPRSRLAVIAVALLAVLLPRHDGVAGNNSWTMSGPFGGWIREIDVNPANPQVLWVAANVGGAYRSVDGGKTWALRTGGTIAGRPVGTLALAPSRPATVYLGTDESLGRPLKGRVYRTTDSGVTWANRSAGLPGTSVRDLLVHPTKPDVVYAVINYGGVFKTTDGGKSWVPMNDGLTSLYGQVLEPRPDRPNVLFVGTASGVFRSTDGAESWEPRTSGLTTAISSIQIDPADPGHMVAGTYGSGVYSTTDAGGSWAPITSNGLPDATIDELVWFHDPETLFAVTRSHGVYELPAPGTLWTARNGGIVDATRVATIAVTPQARLFVGTHAHGIYRSADLGVTWARRSRGLTASVIATVAVDPAHPATVYAGSNTGLGVFESSDSGTSWSPRNEGLTFPYVSSLAVSPSDPLVLYAGTYSGGSGDGVFASTDGAEAWSQVGLDGKVVLDLAIHPNDDLWVWAATSDGLFVTFNGGMNWDPVAGLPVSSDARSIAVAPSDAAVLYAGGYRSAHRSGDGGFGWSPRSSGLEATATVRSIAIHPTKPRIVFAAVDDFGVYRTIDAGLTWVDVTSALDTPDVHSVLIDPADPSTVYAGTSYGGVLRSTNGGTSWSRFNAGLTVPWVSDLATGPQGRFVYAATNGGGVSVYRYR